LTDLSISHIVDLNARRCFQLYEEDQILKILEERDMELIEAEWEKL